MTTRWVHPAPVPHCIAVSQRSTKTQPHSSTISAATPNDVRGGAD